jgi:hypothetical protein
MVTVSEELNPLEWGGWVRRSINRTKHGAWLLEALASNLEGCPQRHHPALFASTAT